MSWKFPESKSEIDAAYYLKSVNPKRYQLNHYSYLDGMCEHIDLIDMVTSEILMTETCVSYFGNKGWLYKNE